MSKKLLLILFLMVFATGLYAQHISSGTARYEALGSSPFFKDAAIDMFNNPAWTTQYKDYAFGDIGRGTVTGQDFRLTNPYGGVNFGIGKTISLGLILDKAEGSWNLFNYQLTNNSTPDPFTGNRNWTPNELSNSFSNPIFPFKLLFGYTASKNFHIGLSPYFAMWSAKNNGSTSSPASSYEYKMSSSTFGVTAGVISMLKNGWIEGTVDFHLNKFKSDTIYTDPTPISINSSIENDGGMDLSVNIRAWLTIDKKRKIALIPIVHFGMFSYNNKYSNTTTGVTAAVLSFNKNSWLAIGGGVGLNWPVIDDLEISGGLMVHYDKYKSTNDSLLFVSEQSELKPEFKFATEYNIAEWLTGRIGFSRGFNNYSNKFSNTNNGSSNLVEGSASYDSDPIQTMNLGAGIHFGRWAMDATISERWLKGGFNFISGTQTDLMGVISTSYNFK
jgi:hypothetical protein